MWVEVVIVIIVVIFLLFLFITILVIIIFIAITRLNLVWLSALTSDLLIEVEDLIIVLMICIDELMELG